MQAATAERILSSARALLIDKGYSAFSYADIAEAVAIRKASIHHHFPTKAGLVLTVLRAQRTRLSQGTAAIEAEFDAPLQRIQAYVRHWDGCIRGQTIPFCIAALLGAEMPSLPDVVQHEIHLHFTTLEEWLEKTLSEGARRHELTLDNDPFTEAQTLMALVHGAMLSTRALASGELFGIVTEAALRRLAVPSAVRSSTKSANLKRP